jgi:hypothetical protein
MPFECLKTLLASPLVSKGKINFEPILLVETSSPSMIDKGKGVSVPNRSKVENFEPPKRQPSQRLVFTCL